MTLVSHQIRSVAIAHLRTANSAEVTEEMLQSLSGFMQKNDLSISKMAQRLKIGAGTLSRLMAGKYKGDVPRMLERIETYRRETEKKE